MKGVRSISKQIPDKFLEQVRQVDILEIASEHFDLKQTGNIYQAKCIHEGDNDPSLTFFLQTNTFYCFGCGAGKKPITEGSDVISFVMWLDSCSFMEAVTKIAHLKGWDIPKKGLSKEDKQKQALLNQAVLMNRGYWSRLQDEKRYLKYLADRNITKEDVDKWRIGMVPPLSQERYRGSLVFALMNDWGQTVGFSYRNMSDVFDDIDNDGPKYINSAQSAIFSKGSILYGLNFVRRLIREKGYVIIGEGFGDAICAQKYNLPFVSLMGTSLTEQQVTTLKKYTDTIVLWLDGDKGGIAATLRHAKVLEDKGFLVRILNIPNKDPDDVIPVLKEETESFIQENAILTPQFEAQRIMAKYESDVMEARIRAFGKIKEISTRMKDDARQQIFLSQMLERLGLTKEALKNDTQV